MTAPRHPLLALAAGVALALPALAGSVAGPSAGQGAVAATDLRCTCGAVVEGSDEELLSAVEPHLREGHHAHFTSERPEDRRMSAASAVRGSGHLPLLAHTPAGRGEADLLSRPALRKGMR